MALSSITGSSLILSGVQQGSLNATPGVSNPVTASSTPKKSATFVLGGNLASGINQLACFITNVNASANTNIDLTSITNLVNQTGVNCARVKAIMIQNLSTTDDATNGGTASSVTIGNNGTNDWVSQSHSGWFGSAASIFDIPTGGAMAFLTPANAGVLVDATHKFIHVVNNDGTNTAPVQISLWAADT